MTALALPIKLHLDHFEGSGVGVSESVGSALAVASMVLLPVSELVSVLFTTPELLSIVTGVGVGVGVGVSVGSGEGETDGSTVGVSVGVGLTELSGVGVSVEVTS